MILKTSFNCLFFKWFCGLGLVFSIGLWLNSDALAQEELLTDRWYTAQSPNFIVYSQLSSKQTAQRISDLESWRQAAAYIVQGEALFPPANVPNYVYLFSSLSNFEYFSSSNDGAFFYSTPRANFMAFVPSSETSRKAALHQYGHFLQRNFYNLRVPRWYEEGMASYLSRLNISRNRPELERVTEQTHELMVMLNKELSMDRFLYRDEALASPRLIQIANLKSEALLHYLLHGYQEDQFADRRAPLKRYLEYLFEGRKPRFAFDQSFGITTRQLEEEFELYLSASRRPEGEIDIKPLQQLLPVEPEVIQTAEMALMLGELALNSGKLDNAELFFKKVIDTGEPYARAYSGLGDAMRFQQSPVRDQEIARYFEMALEMAPDNPDILLDYGEYWESELQDCEKIYPQAQRQLLLGDIREKFLRSIELRQEGPEAQLALAEYYLLAGQDWALGKPHQEQAFGLLPADSFIMEASAKYAIESSDFDEAERLIGELSQPIHFFGEPDYVTALREHLAAKRRGESYDACAK